jgi:hypothetical protein
MTDTLEDLLKTLKRLKIKKAYLHPMGRWMTEITVKEKKKDDIKRIRIVLEMPHDQLFSCEGIPHRPKDYKLLPMLLFLEHKNAKS